jgi:predicted nucleic acid-binding protein
MALIDPGDEVFLDTSYALALAASTDEHHARALELADALEATGARMIATRAVLFEIGNALARQRYRSASVRLLRDLEADPKVEVLPLTTELYRRAFDLYSTRPDKEWGLIDCASFVSMTDRGLTKALTADEHFQQAGFTALLLEAGT